MSAPEGLSAGGASVLEADPRLARLLVAHGAEAAGAAAVLPVLSVLTGPWTPPASAAVGPATHGLVVLSGLFVRDAAVLHGPGDLIQPWRDADRWLACMPARLAVIGAAFAAAVAPWPDIVVASARPRERALTLAFGQAASAEERVLGVLWRLAARWARPAGEGLALTLALDAPALAPLAGLPERLVAAALRTLQARGALVRRDDATWLLPPAPASSRRDQLRERVAVQGARCRQARADVEALGTAFDASFDSPYPVT